MSDIKKKPIEESRTSIKSRLKISFIPKRKDNSLTIIITRNTKVNPYKPDLIGRIMCFLNPNIN
jgi:hypothetical protein